MGRNRKDKIILGVMFVLCTPVNGPLHSELDCQVKMPDTMISSMQTENQKSQTSTGRLVLSAPAVSKRHLAVFCWFEIISARILSFSFFKGLNLE